MLGIAKAVNPTATNTIEQHNNTTSADLANAFPKLSSQVLRDHNATSLA
jgi:hypothetical protein